MSAVAERASEPPKGPATREGGRSRLWRSRLPALGLLLLPTFACAAEVDGASLAAWWGLPFAGVLLSIALLPLLAPGLWHHHFGKIVLGWSMAFLLPFALAFGPAAAGQAVVHTLLAEYIPFIALLCALFTAAGGIY
ncbi:MAG: sodium:proton antiporter, partial [Rubrivivax sp.]|nr:sodium:proton antiporter [Rubrivivax sp.]